MSVVVKWTVPVYPVATLPKRSFQVTVTLNGWFTVAELGALIPRVAEAGPVILKSWTCGAPLMNAFKRFAVVRWIRGSMRLLFTLSRPQSHEDVPEANTHAPLGAW